MSKRRNWLCETVLLLSGRTGDCHWGAEHQWTYDPENSAKRTCDRCGRHEWMFIRRASEDQPSIVWEEMGGRDLKWL